MASIAGHRLTNSGHLQLNPPPSAGAPPPLQAAQPQPPTQSVRGNTHQASSVGPCLTPVSWTPPEPWTFVNGQRVPVRPDPPSGALPAFATMTQVPANTVYSTANNLPGRGQSAPAAQSMPFGFASTQQRRTYTNDRLRPIGGHFQSQAQGWHRASAHSSPQFQAMYPSALAQDLQQSPTSPPSTGRHSQHLAPGGFLPATGSPRQSSAAATEQPAHSGFVADLLRESRAHLQAAFGRSTRSQGQRYGRLPADDDSEDVNNNNTASQHPNMGSAMPAPTAPCRSPVAGAAARHVQTHNPFEVDYSSSDEECGHQDTIPLRR